MTTRNTCHMRCLKSLASLTLIASSSAFIAAAPAGKADDGRALYNQLLREMGVPASTLTGHATDPNGGLITEGNQIVDQTGNYVRMTGANWSGFETANAAPAGVWTRDFKSCIDQMAGLGFNTLRLPFSVDNINSSSPAPGYVAGIYDYPSRTTNSELLSTSTKVVSCGANNTDSCTVWVNKTPLEMMDEVIRYAGSKGMKVILDCHSMIHDSYTSQPLWYVNTGTGTYSETNWIDTWVMLANRYSNMASEAGDTHYAVVACDLFNEPKDDPRTGSASGCSWTVADDSSGSVDPDTGAKSNPGESWNHAAERCGKAILNVAPSMLIMVEGTQWANDAGTTSFGGSDYTHWGSNLRGAKAAPIDLGDEFPNKVIYSIHDYPQSTSYIGLPENPLPWFPYSDNYTTSYGTYPANLDPQGWTPYWGFLLDGSDASGITAPMHIGEFGSWISGIGYTGYYDGNGSLVSCDYTTGLQHYIGQYDSGSKQSGATPQNLIDQDKQWLTTLLAYMDTAVDRDGTDTEKKGASFTWFCFNANSDDTGGLVYGDDFGSVNTEKLGYLTPHLEGAFSITTGAAQSGAGASMERLVELPSAPLMVLGQSLSTSSLRGGKAVGALTGRPLAGTFAWHRPATVPPLGASRQFVRFTPANPLFRTVLLQVTVKVQMPELDEGTRRKSVTATLSGKNGAAASTKAK